MKIIIAGDLVPTKSNMESFNNGDIKALLGNDLIDIWYEADMRIINLEAPITSQYNAIAKQGPNLNIPVEALKGITYLKPSLLNLANNHILDHNIEGLKFTQSLLDKNNIPYVGVGSDLKHSCKPYTFEREGKKVGIYSCAENEFSIATTTQPGVNPFDPLESLDHIKELSSTCDYVIVLYHGGKEHYRYPSPYLQKVCRKMIEKGASLVICQHSHCIGTYEDYNDGIIVYGQGNFIFKEEDNEFWNNSVLIDVTIEENLKINFIPTVTTSKGIKLAKNSEKQKILENLYKRSQEILDSNFIEKKYEEFAMQNIDYYISKLLAFNKWKSRIDRKILKGYLLRKKADENYLLTMQNYIECEAHRELLIKGIKARRKNL